MCPMCYCWHSLVPSCRVRSCAIILGAKFPHAVSWGETCARCVRRPTERYGHVVARNLEARIVAYAATTSRDQDAFPQSVPVVTAEPLYVVTRFEAYIAFGLRKRNWQTLRYDIQRDKNMGTFADRVMLLQAESSRIKQYLRTLPPDAWDRPSTCTQWQVRDVVAHLVGVAEVYADFVARGIQGDHTPPPGWLPAGMGSAMAGAERTAQLSIAERERLGDQVLAAYDAADDRLNRLLAGLSPQDRARPWQEVRPLSRPHLGL